jgi:hypothetical protein
MSRSVTNPYDKLRALGKMRLAHLGGRGSGRRALAHEMARDYAKGHIAAGANPKALITFVGHDGIKTATLESLTKETA